MKTGEYMQLEKSWREALAADLNSPYISSLEDFINKERSQEIPVYPPENEVFQAFFYTPFNRVKVVIIGQDPYHGKGQAHGLCFSVRKGVKTPPSLKNIYKELESDLGIPPSNHGNLEDWAKQGVLMINATMTVRRSQPKSHYGKGWEQFTDSVVKKLFEREDPLVFILWGNSAMKKCETILSAKEHKHLILKSAHPSPFSAHKFLGCKHFSKTNTYLKSIGKKEIEWKLK